MTRQRTLELWAEIVPDERSYWNRIRLGQTWKAKPAAHAGRLVRIRLTVDTDILDTPDLEVDLELPTPPASTIAGEAEADQ